MTPIFSRIWLVKTQTSSGPWRSRGQLPHRGAHQPGLGTDRRVPDLAVEFGLGHEGGDRVEDDDVEGIRPSSVSTILSASSPELG